MFASTLSSTLISIVGLLLALVIIGALYLIAVPLKKMAFYKRSDVVTYFYPITAYFKTRNEDFAQRGDIFASAKEFSKLYPGKKIYVCNVGPHPIVTFRDTQYIKEFFIKQQYYHKADFTRYYECLWGTGLVLAEGNTWKGHRKIISGSFHYEFLKTNIPLIQRTTKEFLDEIPVENYQSYEVLSRTKEMVGEVVGRLFFGENLKEYTFEGKTLAVALTEISLELDAVFESKFALVFGPRILKLPFFVEYARVMKRVKAFRALCLKIIQQKKSQTTPSNDLLTSLIKTQESEDPSQRFSDDNIIDEFITFFMAGMDTTSLLISMMLYNLSKHPQHFAQLREEREATYNKDKEANADALQQMDVLHSVIKETLRLQPPTPTTFPRVALEDHKIVDLQIRKGDLVLPEFITVFYDEKYFENPEQFQPSRWTNKEHKIDLSVFTPFSAGPRNCIGQHLAIIEAKIVVSEFLNKFDFKLPEDYKLKMTFNAFYKPDGEINLQLFPKN